MDGDIRAAVHKELMTDPLVEAHDIVVEVFDGQVSLNGTVPSQDQSSKAVAAAQRVAGVTAVHNLLAIAQLEVPNTQFYSPCWLGWFRHMRRGCPPGPSVRMALQVTYGLPHGDLLL
jgi:hypothetical protein